MSGVTLHHNKAYNLINFALYQGRFHVIFKKIFLEELFIEMFTEAADTDMIDPAAFLRLIK